MSFWIGFFVGGIFGVMIMAVLVANKDERQYDAPAADVVEVKHGFWGYDEGCDCFVCSICENSALNNYRGLSVASDFCPHCGAKMDGERREV